MSDKNNDKKTLLISVISLLVCICLLTGSTYAYFTDSTSSAVNTIRAGNLDISLMYGEVSGGKIRYTNEVASSTKLFDDKVHWEPGHTDVAYLKVENKGSLALKYTFTVYVSEEIKGMSSLGTELRLSEFLKYDIVDITSTQFFGDREEALSYAEGAQSLASETITGSMLPGDTRYFALIVYMPLSVGNEANYRGKTVPRVQLGISLFATQAAYENDSFGPDYDIDAPLN